jgi:hypothetical protein
MKTPLFRPGGVNPHVCLCDVPKWYASAQTLDCLARTKKSAFSEGRIIYGAR